jgi:hypothetical protein
LASIQDIVQVKLDQPRSAQPSVPSKAFQMKLSENKSLVVYNHISGYILDAVLKAVFNDAH